MTEFIGIMLELTVLIMVAGVCNLIAPKLKLPYTVLLFVVGLLLVPLSHLPHFSFLAAFTLSPDLLFYVFLPILLFESAYNMRFAEVRENAWSTRTLATLWLFISSGLIALLGYGAMQLFNIPIPFEVILLFAVIIGTTDPVAVMALFKEYGAPKRLSFMFEGESCFNDGTGLALFLVTYEILKSWVFSAGLVWTWTIQFLLMIIGGILLGWGFGLLFSHIIQHIKNNEPVEIVFTIVMAHLTFITADLIGHYVHIWWMELKISGVIATVFAGIVMGNYGRTKISPKVEEYMEKFRWFFGFISNSLVFILIGLIAASLTVPLSEVWLPIVLLILCVTIARAVSIYIPIGILNRLRLEEHIPTSWQHLMAWGSLRGALAFMIALLIEDSFTLPNWPFSYTIKEFITVAIIAKIAYTLFFKATTIPLLITWLNIGGQKQRDVFQKIESEILIFTTILKKISTMKQSYAIPTHTLEILHQKYTVYLANAKKAMQDFLAIEDRADTIRQSLALQALGVEKEYLSTLFRYREISERAYLQSSFRLDKQVQRIEKWLSQMNETKGKKMYDVLMQTNLRLSDKSHLTKDNYMRYRAQYIATQKVVSYFNELKHIDLVYNTAYIDEMIERYVYFRELSQTRADGIYAQHPEEMDAVNSKLYEKWLLKSEEILIEELLEKNIISHKLFGEFMQIIEEHVEDIR